jgi:hypothetical protein
MIIGSGRSNIRIASADDEDKPEHAAELGARFAERLDDGGARQIIASIPH